MASRLNPYLSFRDDAREAMEFYHGVFGGKLDMTTFKEFDRGATRSACSRTGSESTGWSTSAGRPGRGEASLTVRSLTVRRRA